MSERYEMIGQCLSLKEEFKRLDIECDALRDKLRRSLPLHEDSVNLDSEVISATAMALAYSLQELQGIQRKIDILNRELGE